MLKKLLKTISITLFLPNLALAFPSNLSGFVSFLIDIGLSLLPLLATVAVLVFVWGVGKFIRAAGNDKEVKDSKNIIIWGIVGLFVLFTIWGIVSFLQQEIGIESGKTLIIPQLKF